MALIKFTSPGVPDLYQGNELMDLSLVDPDNRRPVDYALRARWLDELAALQPQPRPAGRGCSALAAAPHDGRAKLWLTWRLLALRARAAAAVSRRRLRRARRRRRAGDAPAGVCATPPRHERWS